MYVVADYDYSMKSKLWHSYKKLIEKCSEYVWKMVNGRKLKDIIYIYIYINGLRVPKEYP